ncbi:MAG: hypothetical protein M3281_10380 [Chloroflexota bacterium]|nr:hypothetical protein [Chloroflexota bacterium]
MIRPSRRLFLLGVLVVTTALGYGAVLRAAPGAAQASQTAARAGEGQAIGSAELRAQYHRALASRPRDVTPVAQLAQMLAATEPAQGVAVQRALVAAYPHSALARVSLAEAYEAAGRRREAQAATRQALRLEPSYAPAHLLLGKLLATGSAADVEEAQSHLRRALELGLDAEGASEAQRLLLIYDGR